MRRIAAVLMTIAVACAPDDGGRAAATADGGVALPTLGGSFPVGTAVLTWTDAARLEGATADPDDRRQVRAQIWWPATDSAAPRAAYFDRPDLYAEAWGDGVQELLESVRPNARLGAPVADAMRKYPVLLYSHGWNSTRSGATILIEGLAARGFVVVAVEHAYMGLVVGPDGALTPPSEDHFASADDIAATYGGDVAFVLDQLGDIEAPIAGRMDPNRIGAIGHSSGFLAARYECVNDVRVTACANIDAPGPSVAAIVRADKPAAVVRLERAPEDPAEGLSDSQARLVAVLEVPSAHHTAIMDWDYLEAESDVERRVAEQTLREVVDFLDAFFKDALA